MIRIISGVIVGSILWVAAFVLYPFGNFDPIKIKDLIGLLIPIAYWAVVSCTVGLLAAVIAERKRIVAAVLSVLLPFSIIMLIVAVLTPKESRDEVIIYGGALMTMCVLFAAIGGLASKLIRGRFGVRS